MHCDLRILTKGGSSEGSVVVGTNNIGVKITISSDSSLLIPEPFAGYFWYVSRSHVRNSSSDFGSVDKAVEVGKLLGIGKGNMSWLIELKKVIEIFISGSKYFSLIDLN